MNVYTAQIHRERCEVAESCKNRLIALQREIINKRRAWLENPTSYLMDERTADMDAVIEATDQLRMAIEAILEIERG